MNYTEASICRTLSVPTCDYSCVMNVVPGKIGSWFGV